MNKSVLDLLGYATLIDQLRGRHFFVTGGTGFVGKNFIDALLTLNREYGAELTATVLSRAPAEFLRRNPEFDVPALDFLEGDVRSFSLPRRPADFVIHGAVDVGNLQAAGQAAEVMSVCIDGTRRVLDYAQQVRPQGLLFLSSGAIYGPQPPDLAGMSEEHPGGPDPTTAQAAYAEGKRIAEWLVCEASRRLGLSAKIARPFAFIGPWLPTDGPFAVGNFMADSLAGRPIQINGDGTPLRSYMDSRELVFWLLSILLHGSPETAYNVGSTMAVSILDLADAIAGLQPPTQVHVAKKADPQRPASRYVPSVNRAQSQLGLTQRISFADSLRYYRQWLLDRNLHE